MDELCRKSLDKWVSANPSDYWKLIAVEVKHEHPTNETIIAHRWSDPIELLADAIEKIADDLDWNDIMYMNDTGKLMSDSWMLFISPHATYRLVPIGDDIYYTDATKEMN